MKNINKTKYEYLLDCNSEYMNMVTLSFDNKKITYEECIDFQKKFKRE